MQVINYKIILLSLFLVVLSLTNLYCEGTGKRKNFLSHGPSVSAFAQGETVLNNLNDSSVMFYNPSLISFFSHNGITVSRYNLFEGTSYNTASADLKITDNIFMGLSVINLAIGDVELREDPYDKARVVNPGQWEYIYSVASLIKPFDISAGANIKYIYMDMSEKKDGGFAFDLAVSKYFYDVDLQYTLATVGLGLTAQNILGTGIKLDEYREDFQNIYILSSMIAIPVKFRFETYDVFTLSLDLRNEDEHLELYAGGEYKIMEKYAVRAGYYDGHITAGFGADTKYFSVNYGIDFNDIDIINRFSLSYRWSRKRSSLNKNNVISAEAENALKETELMKKHAEEEFNKAKYCYSKKQYIYATEILQKLTIKYPQYKSTNFYYNKIQKLMKDNSSSMLASSFEDYTYSSGFVNYYKGDYSQAAKEWMKYLQFEPSNKEIKEYYAKVKKILDDYKAEKQKKEFDFTAKQMIETGIANYNAHKWIACIKQMEKVQNYVKNFDYTSAFEYYNKAKSYIEWSIKELAASLKNQQIQEQTEQSLEPEQVEYDEKTADEKYREGLVLYARGKYREAESMWELTLRLNPTHLKAKNALKHIKESK